MLDLDFVRGIISCMSLDLLSKVRVVCVPLHFFPSIEISGVYCIALRSTDVYPAFPIDAVIKVVSA